MNARRLLPRLRPVVAALLALASACATVLPPGNRTRLAAENPEQATVYLLNAEQGFLTSAYLLLLDGNRIGAVGAQQYTWFQVAPGEHRVSLNDPALPGIVLAERSITCEAGQTYYVAYRPERIHSDGAILGQGLLYGITGEQTLDPAFLSLAATSEASGMISAYELVGNTAEQR